MVAVRALDGEVKTGIEELLGAILILFSASKQSCFKKSSKTLKKAGLPRQAQETLPIHYYVNDYS